MDVNDFEILLIYGHLCSLFIFNMFNMFESWLIMC